VRRREVLSPIERRQMQQSKRLVDVLAMLLALFVNIPYKGNHKYPNAHPWLSLLTDVLVELGAHLVG